MKSLWFPKQTSSGPWLCLEILSILPEHLPQNAMRDTVECLLQVYKTHCQNFFKAESPPPWPPQTPPRSREEFAICCFPISQPGSPDRTPYWVWWRHLLPVSTTRFRVSNTKGSKKTLQPQLQMATSTMEAEKKRSTLTHCPRPSSGSGRVTSWRPIWQRVEPDIPNRLSQYIGVCRICLASTSVSGFNSSPGDQLTAQALYSPGCLAKKSIMEHHSGWEGRLSRPHPSRCHCHCQCGRWSPPVELRSPKSEHFSASEKRNISTLHSLPILQL